MLRYRSENYGRTEFSDGFLDAIAHYTNAIIKGRLDMTRVSENGQDKQGKRGCWEAGKKIVGIGQTAFAQYPHPQWLFSALATTVAVII
jgi:hypothetical protein